MIIKMDILLCMSACLCYCLAVVAVKFGRMSKKQREKVEDEANYHKQRLNGLSPDNSFTYSNGSLSPTNNNQYR